MATGHDIREIRGALEEAYATQLAILEMVRSGKPIDPQMLEALALQTQAQLARAEDITQELAHLITTGRDHYVTLHKALIDEEVIGVYNYGGARSSKLFQEWMKFEEYGFFGMAYHIREFMETQVTPEMVRRSAIGQTKAARELHTDNEGYLVDSHGVHVRVGDGVDETGAPVRNPEGEKIHYSQPELITDEMLADRTRFSYFFQDWMRVATEHDGNMPAAVLSVPEGMFLPIGVPAYAIVNTDPAFPQAGLLLEAEFINMWYMSLAYTAWHFALEEAREYYRQTISDDPKDAAWIESMVQLSMAWFGARGVATEEQDFEGAYAALAAGLVATSSQRALDEAYKYYGEPDDWRHWGVVQASIAHVVTAMEGREGHNDQLLTFILDSIKLHRASCSVLSDTYNIFEASSWLTAPYDINQPVEELIRSPRFLAENPHLVRFEHRVKTENDGPEVFQLNDGFVAVIDPEKLETVRGGGEAPGRWAFKLMVRPDSGPMNDRPEKGQQGVLPGIILGSSECNTPGFMENLGVIKHAVEEMGLPLGRLDPKEYDIKTINAQLAETGAVFSYTPQGYIWYDNFGAVWADGMNFKSKNEFFELSQELGLASLGAKAGGGGGFGMEGYNRDILGWAQKGSAIIREKMEGEELTTEWIGYAKDPYHDKSKASITGRPIATFDVENKKIICMDVTDVIDSLERDFARNDGEYRFIPAVRLTYFNGREVNHWEMDEVRQNGTKSALNPSSVEEWIEIFKADIREIYTELTSIWPEQNLHAARAQRSGDGEHQAGLR